MKKFLISSLITVSSLAHLPCQANVQTTFIANPTVSITHVEDAIIEDVQRAFMQKNINDGRFIYEETLQKDQDHTRYIYILPGTIFNEETYIEENFRKVSISERNRMFIRRYLRQFIKDAANETNYLGAAFGPATIATIVAVIVAAIVSKADFKHRKDESSYDKRDTYFDTRRALNDHDSEKMLAQKNATADKMLILDEKISVPLSNNHLSRLKKIFKNSAEIPHILSSIGIGLLTGITTGLLVNQTKENEAAVGCGVMATIFSSILAGFALEYAANKVNKEYANHELEKFV